MCAINKRMNGHFNKYIFAVFASCQDKKGIFIRRNNYSCHYSIFQSFSYSCQNENKITF